MNIENYLNKEKITKLLIIFTLTIGCIFSMTYLSKKTSSVEYWQETIEYLDQQKQNVLGLTLTSTTASTAISAIPDDVGTPLANKLADLSGYFLIILAAIYLEKYLLTILGSIIFTFIIPAACISGIISILANNDTFKNFGFKLCALGLSLFLIIPCSVQISMMIDDTYQVSSQLAIDNIEPNKNNTTQTNDEKSWWESIIDSTQNAMQNITSNITYAYDYAKTIFNNLLEAFAIMIVTSCLIPILVFILFAWIVKLIFHLDFDIKVPSIKQKNQTN